VSNPLFLVGPNQGYKQVGDAVAAIQAEVGQYLENDVEIRIVESGGYKPFRIDETIRTNAYSLTVGSGSGVEAIVSGKLSSDTNGAVIFSHNTNVLIKGLVFQDLRYGVLFQDNAHFGIVDKCRFHRCTNASIYATVCQGMSATNNEVHGSARGIGFLQCNGSYVVHNSIYTPPGATNAALALTLGVSPSEFFPEAAIEDRKIFVWNNNVYADGSLCLLLNAKDILEIDSNYNNFYAPGGKICRAVTPGKTHDSRGFRLPANEMVAVVNTDKTSLSTWRTYSNADSNSISVQPHFQQKDPTVESSTVSLQLKTVSTLFGRGSTAVPAPIWGNSSLKSTDLLTQNRGNPPAVGAYEKSLIPSIPDDENDDPVEQMDDTTGVDYTCGDRFSVLDLAVLRLAQQVPCWKPQVHRGYFFARDLPYYLYSQKKGVTLASITFDEFHLGLTPMETGQLVEVNGEELPSSNWNLNGSTLQVHHGGLDLDHLGGDVVFKGLYNDWNDDDTGFDLKEVRYEFRLKEGKRRYILSDTPVDAAPVVVTDDTVEAFTRLGTPPGQFRLGAVVEPWGREIEFRDSNLLDNPTFHYETETLPEDWELTGQVSLLSSYSQTGEDIYPYRGDNFASLTSSGWIGQTVSVDPNEEYHGSVYVSAPEGMTGEFVTSLIQYDYLQRELGESDIVTGQVESNMWFRAEVSYPTLNADAAYAMWKIEGTGPLFLDCPQFEMDSTSTPFNYLPRGADMTIEYETLDTRFYTIKDLDVSPFRNSMQNGFVHIPSVPARQFDTASPADATTLSDWRWSKGRTDVLPWARVGGVNKWRRVRGWDNDEVLKVSREASFGLVMQQPAHVELEPSLPIARQGSRGREFLAEVRNTADNPYAFEDISLSLRERQGEFPGWLARREYGYYTDLGQSITPEANERGEVIGRFIPPGPADVEHRWSVVTGQDNTTFVDLPYEVSKLNHGNPTLHDDFGILLQEDALTGERIIHARPEGAYSVYEFAGEYPVFGSLTIEESSDVTGWDYPLGESRNHLIDETEFFMNYETNRLALIGRGRKPVRATYLKRRSWALPEFPRRLFFENSLVGDLTGVMVRYDTRMQITVQAEGPEGMTQGRPVHRVADVIAQNPNRGDIR